MTNKYKFLLIILLFLAALCVLPVNLLSQNVKYTSGYFRPPLDYQLYLSGTFGELRSNHFHAGIDIKTKGREGEPVYAVADGYVSRIRVSTGGYGKALYITHTNGYVSVYGHLQRFNDPIQRFVKDFQYKKESFTIEVFPKKDEFKVKKGKVVAWSGNTGSSSSPHLHFEIRKEASQHPVNPLLFKNIYVADSYAPRIQELVIYPVDSKSRINGKNDTVFYTVRGKGVKQYLEGHARITVSGNISLGIRVYDPMNDIPNHNGIYNLIVWLDTSQVFGLEMDELSFSTTRYVNSLIDYGYYKKDGRKVIRTQVDTNNRLFIYHDVRHNGIFQFSDSSRHSVVFRVTDVYQNTASLQFSLFSVPLDVPHEKETDNTPGGIYFDFSKKHHFESGNIILDFPANAFYRSFYFRFDSVAGDSTMVSPVYKIHNRFTPVQKSFSISIKSGADTLSYADQLYIAYLDENEESWFVGNSRDGNRLEAKTNLLGKYVVLADTLPPEINPVNIANGKNIARQKSIKIKISDSETGIKTYRATLNGHWILMEYEPKKNLLVYTVDEYIQKGVSHFKLEVTDMVGNESVYEAELVR